MLKIVNKKAFDIIDKKLNELAKSKFRSSFYLRKKERDMIEEKGMAKIKEHAFDFIKLKLAPANPINDGAQTPMSNHPVFVAQHATGTCCRSCLLKWHKIPKGRKLTLNEQNYIVYLIMEWIRRQI